jgi:hypothetical protein
MRFLLRIMARVALTRRSRQTYVRMLSRFDERSKTLVMWHNGQLVKVTKTGKLKSKDRKPKQ